MKCSFCNTELANNAKFCHECGKEVKIIINKEEEENKPVDISKLPPINIDTIRTLKGQLSSLTDKTGEIQSDMMDASSGISDLMFKSFIEQRMLRGRYYSKLNKNCEVASKLILGKGKEYTKNAINYIAQYFDVEYYNNKYNKAYNAAKELQGITYKPGSGDDWADPFYEGDDKIDSGINPLIDLADALWAQLDMLQKGILDESLLEKREREKC